MPPRPFPYPLSIGTDIASISRVRQLLMGNEASTPDTRLARYMRRFLTHREQRQFWDRFGTSGSLHRCTETDDPVRYLTGRWAAKEAVVKAVHWRRLSFKHIQILQRRSGVTGGGPLYALILDKPASSLGGALDAQPGRGDRAEEQGVVDPEDGAELDDEIARPAHAPRQDTAEFTPAEEQDDEIAGQVAQVSISHDGEYATAVCLAAEEPGAGDVGGEAAARGL
ncbi:hypothetical protein LTR08_002700 [Meristemomyces frigidus]|nr:hypothetical protein LTR08_002700 [Meristemomyces frigidus]